MNSNMKRNRGGRMNTGGRNDKRTSYQERQGGMRRATPEKNTPITLDGVYKNTRYTHVIYSLVGSNVQVQVKNGVVYEGVLKTFSPKGDVVLEMAHMVDDNCNSSNSVSSAPSRDRLMDKLIVKPGDVIMVNVTNVDLDYAVKDSFTDAGISKYNGEVSEKNMKELEPWVGEGEIEVSGLESERSNGWDPNDMFRCNAENFNVTSSYDDSLEQYTTKLEKKDTEEYKRREEAASKLAAEIEDTAQYKKNIALENGEGDLDEETRFSAVIRTSEANNQSAPFVQSSGGPGKYVPPNRRPGSNPVVNRPARGAYHQSMGRNPPGHPIIPPTSQQQSPQPPPPQPMSSPHQQQQAPHPSSQQQHGQSSVQKPPRLEALNVNGEEPAPVPTSTASPTVKVASPVSEQPSSKTGENKPDTSHNPTSPGSNKPLGNRETGREDRGKQIEAFKQFSDTIKLDQKKEKEKSIEDSKEQDNTIEKEKRLEAPQKTEEPHSQESPQKTVQEPQSPQKMDPQPSDANRQSEEQKKSTLNPYAQEFVPKPSQPKQAPLPQVPTPPHPQTQSPLAIPQQPIMNIPQPQMIAAGPGGQLYMQQPNMLFNVQTQQTQRKRAVVSVKPDNTAAAVQAAQAAQAATGQPLLAAQSAPQNYVYMPQMVPQPQGYHPQMGQVMRMPPAANPTFMTPQTASVPGMPPTSIPGTVEPSNQTHTGQTGPTMYSK